MVDVKVRSKVPGPIETADQIADALFRPNSTDVFAEIFFTLNSSRAASTLDWKRVESGSQDKIRGLPAKTEYEAAWEGLTIRVSREILPGLSGTSAVRQNFQGWAAGSFRGTELTYPSLPHANNLFRMAAKSLDEPVRAAEPESGGLFAGIRSLIHRMGWRALRHRQDLRD